MLFDEKEYDILKKVSDLTFTDYNIKWIDAENVEGYIDTFDMLGMIEDLLSIIDNYEERLEDMREDVKEHYVLKHSNPYEEYGISEKDF